MEWTYHLPGLPIGNAMNSKGVAVAWTGAGYFPLVKPKPGVPTYLLLIELMLKSSVNDCLRYLSNCRIAGASILGLVDSGGNSALVEALPGRHIVDQSHDLIFRANHYVCQESIRRAKQDDWSRTHSGLRMCSFEKAKTTFLPKSSHCHAKHIRELLTSEGVMVDLGMKAMTHDSFVFEPMKGTVWWRSGGWDQGQRWKKIRPFKS